MGTNNGYRTKPKASQREYHSERISQRSGGDYAYLGVFEKEGVVSSGPQAVQSSLAG